MPIERVDFANSRGQSPAALLELPDRAPVATALFAHCSPAGRTAWPPGASPRRWRSAVAAAPVASMLRLLGSAPSHWCVR